MRELNPVPVVSSVGRRALVSEGQSVRVTADYACEVHDIVKANGFVGAVISIVNSKGVHGVEKAVKGDTLILNIQQGEYETDQIDEGQEYEVGAPVYFDADAKKVLPTGDLYIGRVSREKSESGAIWFLLAPQQEPKAEGGEV